MPIGDGDPGPGYVVIYCTSYFHKGLKRRLFASAYGLQAFRLVFKAK